MLESTHAYWFAIAAVLCILESFNDCLISMAKAKVSSELQEAILLLPQKEKNKLLIRLINKDELLVEQLHYKLLENTESDLVFRRSEILEQITKTFDQYAVPYYKDLLYFVKGGVSQINRHYKVTKDKKGELELLIHLYVQSEKAIPGIKNNWRDHLFKDKFQEYSFTKIKKMNTLLNDIHEDFRVEYEGSLESIQNFITEL
jgi:hypothetical protein